MVWCRCRTWVSAPTTCCNSKIICFNSRDNNPVRVRISSSCKWCRINNKCRWWQWCSSSHSLRKVSIPCSKISVKCSPNSKWTLQTCRHKQRLKLTKNTKPKGADITRLTKTAFLVRSAILPMATKSYVNPMTQCLLSCWTSPQNHNSGKTVTKPTEGAWIKTWAKAVAVPEAISKAEFEDAVARITSATNVEAGAEVKNGKVEIPIHYLDKDTRITKILEVAPAQQITKQWNVDILNKVSKWSKFVKYSNNFIGGSCKYGDKCSYAHGDADLRTGNGGAGKPAQMQGAMPMAKNGMNQMPGMENMQSIQSLPQGYMHQMPINFMGGGQDMS